MQLFIVAIGKGRAAPENALTQNWLSRLKPKVGQFSERTRTTKMSDIHSFTEMTGDKNPVHYDEELFIIMNWIFIASHLSKRMYIAHLSSTSAFTELSDFWF